MTIAELKHRAETAFAAALAAASPARAIATAIRDLESAPTFVLGIGKAAVAMAEACRNQGINAPGMLVTNRENARQVTGFELYRGGHPVPDQGSLDAAAAISARLSGLGEDDHLLVLLSGGGSALMALPMPGLTLDHKIRLNQALLGSGLDIHAMNAVRRLFSRVKGGRLAALAAPARITQWALSDVPGDALISIASGPFAAETTPFDVTLGYLEASGLLNESWVGEALARLRAGDAEMPLMQGDKRLDKIETSILASNSICVEAALASLGPAAVTLPPLEGEASAMGRQLAELIREATQPLAGVAGGETVVRLPARHGLGGRSQELALAFLAAMAEANSGGEWVLLAAGTDGRDGPTDAAGGCVTSEMLGHADAARAALEAHDSHPCLEAMGGLVRCPPTGTNLADLVVVLASPCGGPV
ncbi:glycerate kinase [Alphaproteobacteria bacterium LSUCC0684]